MAALTQLALDGEKFLINGIPTYPGRTYRDWPIEGLLLNARVVNAIFDDLNPRTRHLWAYPDTGEWDPERNVREFLEQLPIWRSYGLLGVTINLQGGSPEGYSRVMDWKQGLGDAPEGRYSPAQPWNNSAFEPDGRLRPDYFHRLERILDRTDELGYVVILGLFYQGQDERLADERAVIRAVEETVGWLLDRGHTHTLVEINNECDVPSYEHEILQPHRVHELIQRARRLTRDGRRLLAGTSFRGGGSIPTAKVAAVSDLLLLHGNRITNPDDLAATIDRARALPTYRPVPVVVNEDDHFDFDRPWNNMLAAISRRASWGFFDAGPGSGGAGAAGNYHDGYQLVPANWAINTPTKQGFFSLLREVTVGA